MADFHTLDTHAIMLLKYNDLLASDATPERITVTAYEPDLSLEVRPVLPLEPRTTYVLVVTSDLTDAGCNRSAPAGEFTQLLQPTPPPPTPSLLDCRQSEWRDMILTLETKLYTEFGIESDTVALVEVFTTESITDDLVTIARRLRIPDLVPATPVITAEPTPGKYQGTFTSYDFRNAAGAFDADIVDGTAAPTPTPVALTFFFTVPLTPTPMPDGGFPIVVFGHGAGGSAHDVLGFASSNHVPVSAIAISDVGSGDRQKETEPLGFFSFFNVIPVSPGQRGICLGSRTPCLLGTPCTDSGVCQDSIAFTWCHTDNDCGDGAPEGACRHECVDISYNIPAFRDNFRQTVADLLQLTEIIKNAAGTYPFQNIKPHKIYYYGVSLGGVLGVPYLALEPDVTVGVLSVPGGGLLNMLDGPYTLLSEKILANLYGLSPEESCVQQVAHGMRLIGQWGLEAADPINYAPYMMGQDRQLCIQDDGLGGCAEAVRPKHLLIHDGIVDHVIANHMKDDLVLAMNLPDAKASLGCDEEDTCGCSGIWRFAMSDYDPSHNDEGHFVSLLPAAQAQWVAYLNSGGTAIATPALCCLDDDSCGICGSAAPIVSAVCVLGACATVMPTQTPTPGPNDCCQGEEACATPVEGNCTAAVAVYNAVCGGGVTCVTRAPTPTPGPSDCCQHDEACGSPPDGLSCFGLFAIVGMLPTPVYDMVCGSGGLCVTATPTPTPGAGDCCQVDPWTCAPPDDGCASGVPVYNAVCGVGVLCATVTPTPTAGPNDCCQSSLACATPIEGCVSGTPIYNTVCGGEGVCVTPTPGPNDCCQDDGACAQPISNELCEEGTTPVYHAVCAENSCVTFTPTPTVTPTPIECPE